ncbi:aldehyde dehydrogenase family protein [Stomatobaculum longum]|uniref:aldehyde dehydrogenase family protein n=1 Tax=Stomatobaculum longum TaxID=796942 RepID=UPI0028EBCE47|nr:aldehyde dehydrogenase family protein [Stomatobaculum longum]
MGSLAKRIAAQRVYFDGDRTKPLAFRLAMLERLETQIREQEDAILAALRLDLSKSRAEAYMTELALIYGELREARQNLRIWARTERVRGSLASFPAKNYVYREPYGVVLILAPWNYPFYLSIAPLIAAIAAGNCAIVKCSAESVHTSALIQKLLQAVFPASYVYAAAPDTDHAELLRQRYDYIFFTGSPRVGKLIMRAASEHLTPVTLELGGKSPCIVDESADIKLAARRIAWGKFLNAGQTCIAVDYVLVQRRVKAALVQALGAEISRRYPKAERQESYPKIINRRHYARLAGLIAAEKEVIGGAMNERAEKIAPTLFPEAAFDHACMREEIFGPLLPIIVYDELETAIREIKAREKPLACYVFTQNKRRAEVLIRKLSFGGGCVNDVLLQIGNHRLPFGGVGNSGMGAYHGRYGFETFSHKKAVVKNTGFPDLPFRYAPFGEGKLKLLKKFL